MAAPSVTRMTARLATIGTWIQALTPILTPDEDQDQRHGGLQVDELVHRARQHEEERAKPQDGEDVRAVDEERIAGDREDGRDAVDREDQVGPLHHQQHQEERRRDSRPLRSGEEGSPS